MNSELVKQFTILQDYYRYTGDKIRVLAYGKTVVALRSIPEPITSVKQVKNIKGIGPKAITKIQEYIDTGKIELVETAKKELAKSNILSPKQQALLDLQTVWGIGPAKAKKLYEDGIRSIDDLEQNVDVLTDQQKIGLKYRSDLLKKVPRNIITSLNVIIRVYLNKAFGQNSYKMEIAGSYRRGAKQSGDIDCLITSNKFKLADVVNLLKEKNIILDILSTRTEKFMGVVHCPSGGQAIRLDIEFVREEEWAPALLYFTGSKEFNVYIRAEAKRKGLLLNEHGIYDIKSGKKVSEAPTEETIFKLIGIKYVSPRMR